MNKHELDCIELLKADNWNVFHKGFPDLFCFKDNKLVFIEVKSKKDKLRPEQITILKALNLRGIKSYKWTQEKGFELIVPTKLGVIFSHRLTP